jgi:hypothetical protein
MRLGFAIVLASLPSLLAGCGGCPTGQFACGQLCITLDSDPLNCGTCGNACGAGRACMAGACVTSCAAGYADCSGTCHDLMADRLNCGACNQACAGGQVCNMGTCGASCSSGLTACSGVCRDLMADVNNCGACGNKCDAGKVCSAGMCSVSCQPGLTNCAGSCRDILTDVTNCGGCGMKCDPGSLCSAGRCMLSCQSSLTNCGGVCRDLMSDPGNCGGCGNKCDGGNVCSNGKCALSCAGALMNCNGGCKDLMVDPSNCGGCGTACAANQVCSTGKCTTSCVMNQMVCNNACTNLAFDPANCGACNNKCPGGANSTPLCVNSGCTLYCARGYLDCNGNAQDGCEVAYASDSFNCGSCGVVCAGAANAMGWCRNAQCGLACNQGFNDCNLAPVDGCESNSQTDAKNCGKCGNKCAGGANANPACVAGACGLACNMGFADCNMKAQDGCESNSASDSANCGKCGNACAMGQICVSGVCGYGFIGSVLVTPQQGAQINQWIGNANQSWSLCYHMGPGGNADGTSTQTFHNQCNNRGPTVTVVSANGAKQFFGGYNSQSWNANCQWYGDSNSFLFSLTNNFKHSVVSFANYELTCPQYGPTWGGGHDLTLGAGSNVIGNNAYCNPGYTYACRVGAIGSAQCQNDFCGQYSFSIDDAEVFVQYGK